MDSKIIIRRDKGGLNKVTFTEKDYSRLTLIKDIEAEIEGLQELQWIHGYAALRADRISFLRQELKKVADALQGHVYRRW